MALAQRVQELTRYRSDFFGRLREILGERPDIRVVGDRFVFQSEVLFDTGSDEINPAGVDSLDKLASAVIDLNKEIPEEIPWVLRVDGHTDKRPITGTGGRFRSNWELSAARAISVVRFLIDKGIPANRLVAAGFRRVPAARRGRRRRGASPQPPHRVEAHRTLGEPSSKSAPLPFPRPARYTAAGFAPPTAAGTRSFER